MKPSHTLKQMIAKTLLSSLSTFGKYLTVLDTNILNKAQYSYIEYRYTYSQVTHLCDLVQDSRKLRLVKERIEATLTRAPAMYEKVLYMYYYHQLSTTKIASVLGLSGRTVFRYLSAALDWFAEHTADVIDPVAFSELLESQLWLQKISHRLRR